MVLLTSLVPTSVSYAAEPVQITDVQAEVDQIIPVFVENFTSIIKLSSPISWQTRRFDINVNQDVMGGKITLQDQSGTVINLTCASGGYTPHLIYYLPNDMNTLKGNETYKLTIYGGASGLKNSNGSTLPQDLVYTFTTTPTPPPNALKQYMFKHQVDSQPYGVDIFHVEGTHMPADIGGIYRLTTLAGDLSFSVDGNGTDGNVSVTIENSNTHTAIYHQTGTFSHWYLTNVHIPAAGAYDLIVNVLNHDYTLTVTGPGLKWICIICRSFFFLTSKTMNCTILHLTLERPLF